MEILDRPIAITDVETSGLDEDSHEILEIGLVVFDQQSLEIISTLDFKVIPEHIETATEFALEINGYNEEDWKDAVSLNIVMAEFATLTQNAIFCAHNITFDWKFISRAFKKTGVVDLMDYHRIDLFTIAWEKLRTSGLKKLNMNEVAKHLGIPEEPVPHRAINGAMTEYEIFKALLAL